jgi:DNA polymerase I-like protein with 3'-5' exonuclease and polymerase domains
MDTYDIPAELLHEYVLDDAEKCGLICLDQRKDMLEEQMAPLLNLQMEFMIVLSDMELNGFLWDNDVATSIAEEYTERVKAIDLELLEMIGEPRLNIGSSEQLSAALFGGEAKITWKEWYIHEYKTKPYSRYYEREYSERVTISGLGFGPEKGTQSSSKKGVYSTDKGVIQRLKCKTPDQRRVKKLLLQRSADAQVVKMIRGSNAKTGLMSKIQPDGCIHPSLNQTVAATGRLSCSDPNGQNLPRGGTSPIKKCIVPRFDGIGQFDLSQIEWRAAGWLSRDKTMIFEINNGVDQHVEACVHLMELEFVDKSDPTSKQNRTDAKIFNFRMIYGGSAYGFYMDHKMPNFSKKKWERIVRGFFKKYYGLEAWQIKNVKWVTEGGTLGIPTGRKFALHKIMNKKGELVWNERQVKNYPVQSIAGDILYLFAVILRRGMIKAGLKSKMILTVHDSIVFDYINEELDTLMRLCFKIIDQLPQYITNYFKLSQPWDVKLEGEFEVGQNYAEMKEVFLD